MLNRITLIASSIVALIVASVTVIAQPGQAQTTAQNTKQAAANECLSKPQGVAPKGSHWWYRIDRPSGRRCWYLGAEKKGGAEKQQAEKRSTDKQNARRAAAAERRANAAAQRAQQQDDAPPTPRARSERRSVATMEADAVDTTRADHTNATNPTANMVDTSATNPTANTVDTKSVTASRFSAAWPAVTAPAGSSDREGATAAGTGGAEEPTTTETHEEGTSSVWPALAPADAAAAGVPSEPAPGIWHLLLFLTATIAFIAVAVHAVLKLLSRSTVRIEPRQEAQRAAPVIRTRAQDRLATDHISEPATQGRALRPLDIASRWDATAARLPRTPSVPLYHDTQQHGDAQHKDEDSRHKDESLSEQETPALRRRRVA